MPSEIAELRSQEIHLPLPPALDANYLTDEERKAVDYINSVAGRNREYEPKQILVEYVFLGCVLRDPNQGRLTIKSLSLNHFSGINQIAFLALKKIYAEWAEPFLSSQFPWILAQQMVDQQFLELCSSVTDHKNWHNMPREVFVPFSPDAISVESFAIRYCEHLLNRTPVAPDVSTYASFLANREIWLRDDDALSRGEKTQQPGALAYSRPTFICGPWYLAELGEAWAEIENSGGVWHSPTMLSKDNKPNPEREKLIQDCFSVIENNRNEILSMPCGEKLLNLCEAIRSGESDDWLNAAITRTSNGYYPQITPDQLSKLHANEFFAYFDRAFGLLTKSELQNQFQLWLNSFSTEGGTFSDFNGYSDQLAGKNQLAGRLNSCARRLGLGFSCPKTIARKKPCKGVGNLLVKESKNSPNGEFFIQHDKKGKPVEHARSDSLPRLVLATLPESQYGSVTAMEADASSTQEDAISTGSNVGLLDSVPSSSTQDMAKLHAINKVATGMNSIEFFGYFDILRKELSLEELEEIFRNWLSNVGKSSNVELFEDLYQRQSFVKEINLRAKYLACCFQCVCPEKTHATLGVMLSGNSKIGQFCFSHKMSNGESVKHWKKAKLPELVLVKKPKQDA